MTDGLRVAAVDLGATSGRVMAGRVGQDVLRLEEMHRFPNGPVRVAHDDGATLFWDILAIHQQTLTGLRRAHAAGPVDGIGIDSWAVDYGLLAGDGTLLGNPVCHRDARTDGVMEQVLQRVSRRELYDVTGLQQLPFNTLYQLVAACGTPALEAAQTLLMLPDLLVYWLTGQRQAEATNASTTQLYDVREGDWAHALAHRLGVPSRILPRLRRPGDVVGDVLPAVAGDLGVREAGPVVAVGSHDTASAVVAVPMRPGGNAAYISSGTWSLVGVELDRPVLSDAAMEANFTNEGGVDGTIRFLRNVTGLWVLSETMRAWELAGAPADLDTLIAEASQVPALRSVVDVDAPAFLAPGDMTGRVEDACRAGGQPVPDTRAELARCILDSLALAYRRTVRQAAQLSGRDVDTVHVVGGGALNTLLCQLTADACALPVLAGPVEATALGNVLVQARSLGVALPDLASMRDLVRRTHGVRRYEPSGPDRDWDEAESRATAAAPRWPSACAPR
jgi:rhamnulokinase